MTFKYITYDEWLMTRPYKEPITCYGAPNELTLVIHGCVGKSYIFTEEELFKDVNTERWLYDI